LPHEPEYDIVKASNQGGKFVRINTYLFTVKKISVLLGSYEFRAQESLNG
jgi:hypothetical protein